MKHLARTCTRVRFEGGNLVSEDESRPLSEYRDLPAYVLIAASGAGKTSEFESEAEGSNGEFVTARDFASLDRDSQWRSKTLFVDALDELPRGRKNGDSLFLEMRRRLDRMGKPKFRISCREADWLGPLDGEDLRVVSANGEIQVLRLDPLGDEDILQLLKMLGVEDPKSFLGHAKEQGIETLLHNPLNVKLLSLAVGTGSWPNSRTEVFDLACAELVREPSRGRRKANPVRPSSQTLLDAAGRLCTLQMLADLKGFSQPGADPIYECPALVEIPNPAQEVILAASHSRLFETIEGRTQPVHQHIAEFLAAKHIAVQVSAGLPKGRILSLATGEDGGFVARFRGLAAWLASIDPEFRVEAIERDPIGLVSYGDVRGFSQQEKLNLIESLERLAGRDPWTLAFSAEDARWGDLATPDMQQKIFEVLRDPSRTPSSQAVVKALLEGIGQSADFRPFVPALIEVIRDAGRMIGVRRSALQAFTKQNLDVLEIRELETLLEDLFSGVVPDPEDSLLGQLLMLLYPRYLPPGKVVRYLRDPKRPSHSPYFIFFWRTSILEESSPEQIAELLDALLEQRGRGERKESLPGDGPTLVKQVPRALLAHFLSQDDDVEFDRLYAWLDFVGDLSLPPSRDSEKIAHWLSDHPAHCQAIRDRVNRREEQPYLETHRLTFGAAHKARPARAPPTQLRDGPNLQREAWHNRIKRQEAELRGGKCATVLLQELALVYLGMFTDVSGNTPRARLKYYLNDDDQLIETVLHALGSCLERQDLPDPAVVARMAGEGLVHPLAHALIAAMNEASRLLKPLPGVLGETGMRLALSIYFNVAMPQSQFVDPWYKSIVAERPELVCEALLQSAKACWQYKGRFPIGLDDLAVDEGHTPVARAVALPLLKAFPPRATEQQLPVLRSLLRVAFLHCRKQDTLEMVEQKLLNSSMHGGQRIYWLGAGLLLSCDCFVDRLESELKGRGSERRVRHLSEFLSDRAFAPWLGQLGVTALKLLTQIFAQAYRPSSLAGPTYWGTPEVLGSILVGQLVERLSHSPSRLAGEALSHLRAEGALAPWRARLGHALENQATARREAGFHCASFTKVLQVLDNDPPTSVRDLFEVAKEFLAVLAQEIRHGNASDWHQYWDFSGRNLSKPRIETLCRDSLFSSLKHRLQPRGILVEKEGSYADDARADIRITYKDWNIPVEVKKSGSRDLWTAIDEQLVPKYTRDPGAQGYGIYLVFWFGGGSLCTGPPNREPKPESAEELERKLQELFLETSADLADKIGLCVIDVSSAGGASP